VQHILQEVLGQSGYADLLGRSVALARRALPMSLSCAASRLWLPGVRLVDARRPALSQRRTVGTLTPRFRAISPIASITPASHLLRDQL
jgi:hypothetical protein